MQFNGIIITYVILWLTSILFNMEYSNLGAILLPYTVTALNEIAYAVSGADLFDARDRTEIFYDISSIPTRFGKVNHNYSEGYYPDEDYSINPREAETNKYAKILDLLGAKEGDTILDMGSGMCPFEVYCKERGIRMIGLTLSSEQVDACKDKQVSAERWDFTAYNEKFKGRIDHIVIMGSPEHIYTGGPLQVQSYTKKHTAMKDLFEMSKSYFKNDGRPHRIFYSGLHLNPSYMSSFGVFVLERMFGATLQLNTSTLDIVSSGKNAGYNVIYKRDATRDYYMATVLDRQHFGNPVSICSKTSFQLLLLSAIYPLGIYMWLYYVCGLWMWMFDGNFHKDSSTFSLKSMDDRPCTLWWCVLETPQT